jgi:dihydroorotase
MSERWLIHNAELVNEGRRFHADLRIRDGRIEHIGHDLTAAPGEHSFNATGLWLLPGMIDVHVHFREPGLVHKADIAHESRACVAGGITSFMDMPNTLPPVLDADTLAAKYALAADRSRANYAFYFGASNDNLEAIKRLDPRTTPGVKVFLGCSTGNMLVNDPATLEAMFAGTPVPILTHCEDSPTIDANLAVAKSKYGEAIPAHEHPRIRSREACLKSTRMAVELARRHGTRLHIPHVSTADELALFQPGPAAGKRITAETCVHFLHFTDADYDRLGFLIKCNPAIKAASDRAALLDALVDGRLDLLATDHAPHLLEEKQRPYTQAPSGLPLVQYALQAALEHVHDGRLTLERLAETTSHAPATLFDVAGRGFLREGYFADFVLVDPKRPHTASNGEVLSKCGWTPFDGVTFRSSIAATFVNGNLAFDGRRVRDDLRGMRLAFAR